jgi:hypothetical protein
MNAVHYEMCKSENFDCGLLGKDTTSTFKEAKGSSENLSPSAAVNSA